jgi:hypothetical protein
MNKVFSALVGLTISLPSVFATNELTVTGATAQDKLYDGRTNAVISLAGATTNGVIPGDDVQVTNLAGWFATPGAGTNIPVTAALALTGAAATNYTLTQPTGLVAAITKKALAVELVPPISKMYDGNTNATLAPANYKCTGLISGEVCTVNQKTGTYASKNAATGIVVSVTLAATNFTGTGGFLANNYLLPASATGAVGEITKRRLIMNVNP